MDCPSIYLNEMPEILVSPTISEPGLDDIESNVASIFSTHNANVNVEDEVGQAIHITQSDPEAPRVQLGSQGKKKELSSAERLQAYECLLERVKDGKLKRGSTSVVAAMFGVGIRSIQRLWKRAAESGDRNHDTLRVRNCGRKRIEFDIERMRDIPLRQRTTIRSLVFSLGVSKSVVHRKFREGAIRRHTNAVKPSLTQENMTSRIQHCLNNLDPTTLPQSPTFKRMQDTIHIDEKWFFLTKRSQRYYLLRDEPDPVRCIKNSNYIPKIMFLTAVARPRFANNGVCTFDGKIGVFPLVESVAAVRSSQNRPRGTLEIKPITNITREVIREFMIHNVLPAITQKWPRDSIMEKIYIQQDNARSHVHFDDVEFLCAVDSSGLDVSIVCQPPNSPDLNVLDLGFFRAIQSLQSKDCAKSITELIGAVQNAYQTFSVKKSNYIFLTLQTCMTEILKCDGSNTYKIPHIKKEALAKLGDVPLTIQCNPEVYATALHLLPQ